MTDNVKASGSRPSLLGRCGHCKWWVQGANEIMGDCTLFSSVAVATTHYGVLAGAYGDNDEAAHLETDKSFGCVSFEEAE